MKSRVNADTDRRPNSTPVRWLTFKWLVFALLCALPAWGLIAAGLGGAPCWPAVIYPLMSLIAFALYGHDKKQARLQGPRTPEKYLHAAELLGGWPGALIAQQAFRHKTRKVAYQWVFWLIVLVHELFWIDRVLPGGHVLTRHLF